MVPTRSRDRSSHRPTVQSRQTSPSPLYGPGQTLTHRSSDSPDWSSAPGRHGWGFCLGKVGVSPQVYGGNNHCLWYGDWRLFKLEYRVRCVVLIRRGARGDGNCLCRGSRGQYRGRTRLVRRWIRCRRCQCCSWRLVCSSPSARGTAEAGRVPIEAHGGRPGRISAGTSRRACQDCVSGERSGKQAQQR